MTPTSFDPGWELYRSLLSVLDEGSLSGAARALGITQPTVGRHIAALEKALGQSLFTRSPTGLLPTEAALGLRPYLQTLASTAAALQRAATGHASSVSGTVRITASEVMGVEVLPPMLQRIRARHPELVLELSLSNAVQDLLRRDADIAVRMVPPQQSVLIARRIGRIPLGFHAHRDYLARAGKPRTLDDLRQHTLIGFDRESAFHRAMAKSLPSMRRDRFALRTDSDLAQLAAVRAGFGIGVCQVPLARRDPALQRVLARQFTWPLDTWLTMHEDLRHSPRCKAVFEALAEELAAYMAGL
jgi:DNA-binding transcriptional LysR family regulator